MEFVNCRLYVESAFSESRLEWDIKLNFDKSVELSDTRIKPRQERIHRIKFVCNTYSPCEMTEYVKEEAVSPVTCNEPIYKSATVSGEI